MTDRLKELRARVSPFVGAESPSPANKKKYLNRLAEAYFVLREKLIRNQIAITPDEKLAEELMATTFSLTASGKIAIEPKDEIRSKLGRSPDRADALSMAFAEPMNTATTHLPLGLAAELRLNAADEGSKQFEIGRARDDGVVLRIAKHHVVLHYVEFVLSQSCQVPAHFHTRAAQHPRDKVDLLDFSIAPDGCSMDDFIALARHEVEQRAIVRFKLLDPRGTQRTEPRGCASCAAPRSRSRPPTGTR